MKFLTFIFLILTNISCHANEKCEYTESDLKFSTPNASDISNTFWQQEKDGYETVKRLYITYKDGSIAVIEHRFCSMYNFEVSYYLKDKQSLVTIEAFSRKIKSLFIYSAIQDSTLHEAIETITNSLREKKFSIDSKLYTGYDASNEKIQAVNYSLSYLPIDDSSIHNATFSLYMGVGGIQ